MDRLGIHILVYMTLTDAQYAGIIVMIRRRPLEMKVSWRKLVS
jgi:hypothetical protein